jgi:hypothetical protein
MSLLELFLTPIYILLLYLFFKWRRKKLPNDTLKKYHRQAFWIKILASILFVLYYTYLTGGDTRSLYYTEGHNFYQHLLSNHETWKYIFSKGTEYDPSLVFRHGNEGYFLEEGNFMVIRLTALLSFITFGKFVLINLIFGCFAFSGIWKLFMFFYNQRPHLHKAIAISILFFPSVVFWSSGLLKDSLCIGALGWLTYSLSQIIKRKKLVRNSFLLFLSVYLLSVVKVYILLAYAPLLLLYFFLRGLQNIRFAFFKYLISITIFISIIFIFSQVYNSLESELDAYAIDNLASSISSLNETIQNISASKGAESNFNLGAEFDGTFAGLLKISPFALVATFFRPFIWETGKISQLMAAVESLILFFFTLKIILKTGPYRFIKYILADPLIFFCISFAITFGLFVGASTLNFGTLVRYKIPCMPFYTIALFLIYDKVKSIAAEKKSALQAQVSSPSLSPA